MCFALRAGGSPREAKLKVALRRVKRVPTLLIWGDRDCTVSLSSGIKLHRRLRASELMVVPGGGHSVFEESPEAANRVMLEWLRRHPLTAVRPGDLSRVPAGVRRARGSALATVATHKA